MLLDRLEAIGRSLAASGHGLALIGLGSVGLEQKRLDEYSDLDFFAIVDAGWKQQYIEDTGWLAAACPIAYAFRNTSDGCKLLYEDGVFCEFAVFEPDELRQAAFAPGRVIWKQAHIPDSIAMPANRPAPPPQRPPEWLLGEALTNLYVGMERFLRGEKLSAQRFIQHYAVDRLLELAALVEEETPAFKDTFANERRFEQRFPQTARLLPEFVQGYERSPQSAAAILEFLRAHFEINSALASAVATAIAEAAATANPPLR